MPKAGRKKKQAQKPYEKTANTTTELDDKGVVQDTESTEEYICVECKKLVDEVVQCEKCIKWYCCVCQNINEKMYEALFEFSKLYWFCNGCESDAIAVFHTSTETGSSKEPLSCLESKITDLMSNAVQQLTKVIKEGKNQIREASECMKNTLSKTTQESMPSSSADNTTMDIENLPNSSLSFSETTSEVITTAPF